MAIPLPQIFGDTRAIITSGFGPRKNPTSGASKYHRGVDIAAQKGTPVRSLAGGKVIDSGYNKKDGFYIKVDHGSGYQSSYGHLDTKALFDVGQEIQNGQVIGQVGSTGISTGPHTHVGIKKDGKYINPKSIQDLELLIRPDKTENKPTVQTVSKPFISETTPPTKEVNTTENINTMSKPNQTAGGTYQKEGRGKVYATSGDMATDILGKNIGQVSANELMTMAMNQGYSRKDAKRAVKGLEKFQKLGGQAEMVFDPGANKYNVIFKNEDGVVVDPRQSRKLGSNAAFGAADLLGLGRNVNTLASVISRQRAVNAQAMSTVPPTVSKTAEPTLDISKQSQLQVETPKTETPEVETEIPGEGNVLQEESVVSIPPLLKRPNIHYGIDLDTGLPVNQPKPEVKSQSKVKSNTSDVFRKAAYRATKDDMVFDETYLKYLQDGYAEELKKFPNLTPEQHLTNVQKQQLSDGFNVFSLIAGGAGLKASGWVTKEGAKKIVQTKAGKYVWDAVKGGWRKVSSFFKSAPTPKSPTIAKPVTQPNLPLANELPTININKNALSKLSGEARKKFDDAVSWQGNSWSWRKGLSPERQAEIIKDMKSYGILKKGGKLSAASLMGLPKAQGGIKIDDSLRGIKIDESLLRGENKAIDFLDINNPIFQQIFQQNGLKSPYGGPIINTSPLTYDFGIRKKIPLTSEEQPTTKGDKSGRFSEWVKGLFEKNADIAPGKKFDWKNTLEGAGIIGGPLLASLQKQPRTTIPLPQKLQFRAPVAADLPRPQVMNVSPNLRDMGTDIQTRMMYGNMAEAQNKQIANQWNVQNALQKREAQRAGMDILNRQDMINAQMLGDVQVRQSYLDAQRRQGDFANKIGSQQAAFGNLADRSRWAAADRGQSIMGWAQDVIKNAEAYGGTKSAQYQKAMQIMNAGLGMTPQGKYGIKLKAVNLLKK